jgi:hypothetical protein
MALATWPTQEVGVGLDRPGDEKMTIQELVESLPSTFVAKKQRRGLLEQAGIAVDANGTKIGEFQRHLDARREREAASQSEAAAAERDREAARKEFAKQGREAEIKLMAGVAPHWPTYRKMLGHCDQLAELFSAAKFRDTGDILANRGAIEAIGQLLVSLDIEEDPVAGDIWCSVLEYKSISDKQAKALAVAVAKAATLRGVK